MSMSKIIQAEIHRVYLKDVSFESSSQARTFTSQWKPHIDINLNAAHHWLEKDGLYEVVLNMTITARQKDATAFLIEVQQAGTFKLAGVEDQQVPVVLQTHCANVLFPFAREVVADLVAKGGFPQLLLGPIDFQTLYQQRTDALKEQESGKVTH